MVVLMKQALLPRLLFEHHQAKCEITEAETGSYAVEFIRISPPLFRFDSFLMELFTI